MIPYILAAIGGYLIGDSLKGKRFAEGGMMDDEQIYFMVRPAFVNELMDKAKKENVELEFIETDEDGNEVYFGIVNFDKLKEFKKLPIQYKYSEGGVMKDGNVEFKPYGKTKGNYKLEYKVDGEHQSEIWESKEMVEDAAKRYSKIGYTDIKITEPKMMAKGGMVVTSIKDIPNFKQRLKEGKITYRGLGMGKLAKDFYDLAGTNGTRIKVDGKEYFITVEEFDTFSRDANGKMRIRFDAPYRKFEEGGMMANGGRIKVGTFSEEQLKNKEDKKAVEKAQKESGLTYVDTKIIKKGGKMYLDVYLIPNEEYYNSSKFAKGGGVESYSELRKVPKKVAGELTLSPNRTAKLTANKLMLIDNNIWEELDINSGSELYNDDELQKKYVEKLEKANVDKIISSENLIRSKVMDLLEENNYSSLHQYFIYKGVFGEAKRNDYIDMYNSGGSYMFLNPALFTSDLHGKPFSKPKMAKGGDISRKGTYTGRIVSTQSGERMIGKISGYRGNGEPVYDVHNFGSLRKDMREKVGELSNSKIKELLKNKMAKGGQVYKLGDKWNPNFDYTGMLETALKADVSWGIDKLKKLYDSLEDVNYHTASRSLWEALKSLKANDIKAAEKNLENFRSDVMEELK